CATSFVIYLFPFCAIMYLYFFSKGFFLSYTLGQGCFFICDTKYLSQCYYQLLTLIPECLLLVLLVVLRPFPCRPRLLPTYLQVLIPNRKNLLASYFLTFCGTPSVSERIQLVLDLFYKPRLFLNVSVHILPVFL